MSAPFNQLRFHHRIIYVRVLSWVFLCQRVRYGRYADDTMLHVGKVGEILTLVLSHLVVTVQLHLCLRRRFNTFRFINNVTDEQNHRSRLLSGPVRESPALPRALRSRRLWDHRLLFEGKYPRGNMQEEKGNERTTLVLS